MGFLGSVLGGVGSSLLGGFLGSSAAKRAGQIEAQGATTAGNLAQAAGQQGIGNYQQQLGASTAAAQPYMNAGAAATGQLSDLLAPGGFLSSTWNQQFQAPTQAEAEATPGYQFTLGQGIQALNRGAAAKGNLLSSGAAKQLMQYGSGLANQTYNDVYNRAMGTYQQNYNQFLNNQQGLYGRLMGMSNQGLTATAQLNQLRQQAAAGMSGVGMQAAGMQGQDITNAAAARAGGVMNAANAWRGALGQAGNMAMDYGMMNMMNQGSGGGSPFGGQTPMDISSIYGGQSSPVMEEAGNAPWIQGGADLSLLAGG